MINLTVTNNQEKYEASATNIQAVENFKISLKKSRDSKKWNYSIWEVV